ncbi:MAG: hypothetical protein JSW39_04825 [Desulfobacterales bacterium]|nr:MAG: hypothetical protein JSW39_04825 [Desulfobacterales bacterium]
MIFRKIKRKPPRPPIYLEKDYIIWLLKYNDVPDIKLLNEFFGQEKLDRAVDIMANDIMKNLKKHADGERLANFLSKVQDLYAKSQSLLAKHGGFWSAPEKVQVAYLQLTAKMVTLPYFIRYKYGVEIALADFNLPEFEKRSLPKRMLPRTIFGMGRGVDDQI